jgi:hypothetical protein
MPRFALLCLLALAACGVDGAPQPPASGVTLSGSAEMGMARDGG